LISGGVDPGLYLTTIFTLSNYETSYGNGGQRDIHLIGTLRPFNFNPHDIARLIFLYKLPNIDLTNYILRWSFDQDIIESFYRKMRSRPRDKVPLGLRGEEFGTLNLLIDVNKSDQTFEVKMAHPSMITHLIGETFNSNSTRDSPTSVLEAEDVLAELDNIWQYRQEEPAMSAYKYPSFTQASELISNWNDRMTRLNSIFKRIS